MRVASVTKSVTAAAVMKLVERGQLTLDEPVSRRLPELPGADRYTLRQVLGHRSGLPAYQTVGGFFDHATEAHTPAQLLEPVTGLPLEFSPGSKFSYSNSNFIVAGMVVERVTGEPIQAVLRREVLAPLGLGRTWLAGSEPVPEPTARGYSTRVDERARLLPAPGPLIDATDSLHQTNAWTTGALVSTVDQIALFFAALSAAQVVNADSLKAMQTSPDPPAVPSYGLGLWRYGGPTKFAWGHSGDTFGFLTFAATVGDTTVAVTCNDDRFGEVPRRIAEAIGETVTSR